MYSLTFPCTQNKINTPTTTTTPPPPPKKNHTWSHIHAMPLATILIEMVETNETETKSFRTKLSHLTLLSLKSPTPTPYSASISLLHHAIYVTQWDWNEILYHDCQQQLLFEFGGLEHGRGRGSNGQHLQRRRRSMGNSYDFSFWLWLFLRLGKSRG